MIRIIFTILILLVFRTWFLPGVITGGDMWYYFESMYGNHQIITSAVFFQANNGFGGPSVLYAAVNFVMGFIFFFGKTFNLPWEILQRVFILWPFIATATVFPYLLFKKIFPKNTFAILASFVFLFNTYILMLVSGGLVVIGLAYALIPLVFLFFLKIFEEEQILKNSLILGLVLALQSVLDVRVTYVALVGMSIFYLVRILIERKISFKIFSFAFLIPLLIDLILNSFWILPALTLGANPLNQLGSAYTSAEAVKFFSFAKFENSLSLLHPNWPENIFGKTYFLRPEFLVLPILAFSSLFFITKENKKTILPLVLIGLVGAFLAKGANEPFGQIYIFLFDYFPGFVLFRDPTKWYMLVAFSYSLLIPFSIWNIYRFLKSKVKNQKSKLELKIRKFIPVLFLILSTLYLILLILPAITGKLPGTFQKSEVPEEYKKFEEFLSSQEEFSRVLWIPQPYRFSYYSPNHPAVSANLYFDESDPPKIAEKLNSKEVLRELSEKGVKYIAIPSDPRGELFLKDRKYSKELYLETVSTTGKIENLKSVNDFGSLKLFEINR